MSNKIKLEHTKQGLKITHPTGVIQVLNVTQLVGLKNRQERRKEKLTEYIARINAHIATIQNIS